MDAIAPATPVDVIYALGKGSIHQNIELKYSLRSLEMHARNIGNVFLIGEKPKFLNYEFVQHIHVRDNNLPERNIKNKIIAACELPQLSERFLFVNDDHFLLKEIDAANYPYYFKKNMSLLQGWQVRPRTDEYAQSLKNTHDVLSERGLPGKHFDIHYPIVYNKYLFPQIIQSYNWSRKYVSKSLYSNSLNIEGIEATDLKLNRAYPLATMMNMIADREIFSIGDYAFGIDLHRLFQQLYPNKSKYEI